MQRKNIVISAIITLLVCGAVCAAITFSAFYIFNRPRFAHAARGSAFTVIGGKDDDIWLGGAKPFDGGLLNELYSALICADGYADLEQKIEADPDGAFTSADFRAAQGGTNNVSVWFGGIKWDAVRLEKDRLGESVILTLWQSADGAQQTCKWADRTSASNNPAKNYPDNMYSTSLIRVLALNAGGYASKTATALGDYTFQSAETQYARFTMPPEDFSDSVTEYLALPKDVAAQEIENAAKICGYTLPNDAYGTPLKADWYDKKFNYAGKGDSARPQTLYEAWQYDYLWLPSLAETGSGNSAGGLWETNAALRSAAKSSAWLRSGDGENARYAYCLDSSGKESTELVNTARLVRPALHLNLTKAEQDSAAPAPEKPTCELEKITTYDGEQKTLDLPLLENVTYKPAAGNAADFFIYGKDGNPAAIAATEAGEYTAEALPPASGWKDGTTEAVRFTLTIEKAEIAEDWSKFPQFRETYFRPDGTTYALKLPEPDEDNFPLSLAGKTELSAEDITLKYIVESYDDERETFDKEAKLAEYMAPAHDGDWTDYAANEKFNVGAPKHYCVFFRAQDPEGNHKTLYDCFSLLITDEKLTINLARETRYFETEYGETARSQAELRKAILADIPDTNGVVVTDGGKISEDRTSQFKAAADKFEFYFCDGDGAEYAADGETSLEAGKTYYLYVRYLGEKGVKGSENFITFTWAGGRPYFKVTPRKIKVELTAVAAHVYNTDPPPQPITATPSRPDGNWYGTPADNDVSTLNIKYTFKKSDGAGGLYTALTKTMPAGQYVVTATSGNANYEFTSKTLYTVNKGNYADFDFGNLTATYTGKEVRHEIDRLPDGVRAEYGYIDENGVATSPPVAAGVYKVTATFKTSDPNYNAPDPKTAFITITRAELDFRLGSSSGVYTGGEQDLGVIFYGLVGGEKLKLGADYALNTEILGAGTLGENGLPAGAGEYAITPTLTSSAAAANYVIAEGARAVYTVLPAQLKKPASRTVTAVYKGCDCELIVDGFDFTKMNAVPSDGAAFDCSTGVFSAKDVGEYALAVSLKDSVNTVWTGGGQDEVRLYIRITKAALTIKAQNTEAVYGEIPQFTLSYLGFADGENNETLGYFAKAVCAYTLADGIGENFKITVEAPKTLKNYDIYTQNGVLTVVRKHIILKISDGGHAFGSNPQSKFTFTDKYGGLVAGDTADMFCGLVNCYLLKDGERLKIDGSLKAGSYTLCADGGFFGNYDVDFESGEYIVTAQRVSDPAPRGERAHDSTVLSLIVCGAAILFALTAAAVQKTAATRAKAKKTVAAKKNFDPFGFYDPAFTPPSDKNDK